MKVKIIECERKPHMAGETLEFQLNAVDNAFANGLRRVMLAEIPTLGIEAVTIIQNTSVLPDEMLAHRLGLVPLYSMKARHMNFARDCPCGGTGCSECQITGELHVECPADQHSLQVFVNESLKIDDEEVYPVSAEEKGIWLVTLGRCQKLSVRITIRKNIAKTHAKFMPVATVAMRYAPDIVLNTEGFARLEPEQCRRWAERCPQNVFEYEEKSNQMLVKRADQCIFCRECLSTDAPFNNLPEPLVFVRQRKNHKGYFDFTFVVECTGVLPVLQVLYDAIAILRAKLQRIRAGLSDDPNAEELMKTKTIGGAPTAPVVPDEDIPEQDMTEDHLKFVMR